MKTVRFLFSDDMARAIVQGRKTVTRRPGINLPPSDMELVPEVIDGVLRWVTRREGFIVQTQRAPCAPGDILIGRECWADVDGVAVYRADGARTLADWRSEYGKRCAFHGCKYCEDCFAPYMWESKPSVETWRPSIHMPDWAARIRRRVVSVTVERLQDITEDDAVREGFSVGEEYEVFGASTRFCAVWNSVYAAKGLGWDSNCWVWRIEFEHENVQETADARVGGGAA